MMYYIADLVVHDTWSQKCEGSRNPGDSHPQLDKILVQRAWSA